MPAGDALCRAQAERGAARVVTFGAGGDYDVVGSSVMERATGLDFSLEDPSYVGTHNLLNAAAAIAAVRDLGASPEAIARGPPRLSALAAPHGARVRRAGGHLLR